MTWTVKRKRKVTLCTSILLVIIATLCSFMDLSWITGREFYSFGEVWDALTDNGTWASSIIVCELNAPRVVGGLFIGAGLAMKKGSDIVKPIILLVLFLLLLKILGIL